MPETEVNQCMIQKRQDENKQMQCPPQAITVIEDKKCQEMKSVHMWPQKPKNYKLQSRKHSNQVQERALRGSNCYAATHANNKGQKPKSSNPKRCFTEQELFKC